MRNNSLTFNVSDGTTSGLQQRWRQSPAGAHSPVWLTLLGAVLIVGMLLAFHQVVHGAVQQGALRHKAIAAHTEAARRCNALQGPVAGSCLLKLNAAYGGGTELPAHTTVLASQDSFNLR